MSNDSRRIRFGLWYDFRNPPRWRQSSDRLYGEIIDQIAWAENHGFDDVWLSEHHFIEDGYLPSISCQSQTMIPPVGHIPRSAGRHTGFYVSEADVWNCG